MNCVAQLVSAHDDFELQTLFLTVGMGSKPMLGNNYIFFTFDFIDARREIFDEIC